MKRVLILTYYWPPAGGPGVQRWLKFVKYFREFGWEPVVYTVENPDYAVVDESLEKEIPEGVEVLRKKIFEPYSLASRFMNKGSDKVKGGFIENNQSLGAKISTWIRGNVFIPDARMFWISPSVKFLSAYLKSNQVDAIVSTGPPHTMHLIAAGLKNKFDIPWISDFRDPWTNIDYYHRLRLTKFADKEHHRLEKLVLDKSDLVVTVGKTWGEEFQEMTDTKVNVIENGFDFEISHNKEIELDKKFSLSHIGSMNADRNPENLWAALKDLVEENEDFKSDLSIKLVGNVSDEVFSSLEEFDLKNNLDYIEYLQHNEVIELQRSSAMLLLVLNNTPNSKGIITGKMFEYMAASRPIVCVGPEDGDASVILRECKAGEIFGYSNKNDLKNYILDSYKKFKEADLFVDAEGVEKYSRKNATKRFSELLNSIV